ncbi:MAG: 4Fe-4S dicluster domain-containing protein [Deltaproteobacteria bacterium]|nr:4Fe-4S dicluster domain-containing protein [Deltaproteobacteria bacterium]
MFRVIRARIQQGHRTMKYPDGPPPVLPERFRGMPSVDSIRCVDGCNRCEAACPASAIRKAESVRLDMGRCLFCGDCSRECATGAIRFGGDHRLSARRREALVVDGTDHRIIEQADASVHRMFGRSLKLRQVSAGGCNACEADANVLTTLAWDLGRFGIQFVASPRHADGLLVTGPVTENMKLAMEKTYAAVPSPRIVIASGACAISGGPYREHPEVHNGAAEVLPVDLFVPGCPPHPLTLLEALLVFLGRIPRE